MGLYIYSLRISTKINKKNDQGSELTNFPPKHPESEAIILNVEPQPLLCGQDSLRFPADGIQQPFSQHTEGRMVLARPLSDQSAAPPTGREVAGTIPASLGNREKCCQVPHTNNIRYPHLLAPSRSPCPRSEEIVILLCK